MRAERVYLLSEYANINYGFIQAFAYGVLAGIKKLVIALLKGNWTHAKGYAGIVSGLLCQTPAICRIRKQTKQSYPNFLMS